MRIFPSWSYSLRWLFIFGLFFGFVKFAWPSFKNYRDAGLIIEKSWRERHVKDSPNRVERKLGCQVPWESLSSEDLPVCSELDKRRYFHGNYSCIAEYDLNEIMDLTECLKPCTYKEYKLVGSEIFSVGEHGIFFRFVDREVVIEKEMTSYSALSFLADIGGSLGMFLGFSFLMVWDGVAEVLINIRQVWREKKDEHTIIAP